MSTQNPPERPKKKDEEATRKSIPGGSLLNSEEMEQIELEQMDRIFGSQGIPVSADRSS